MRVSVCIPTFNAAKYLRECIESVLAQTYRDFELLISDDGSTDHTCEIAASIRDPRIRVCRLDRNMGMPYNFNNAVNLSRGTYIKLLCYDDLLDPTSLEKQVDLLDRRPEVVMVTSGLHYMDEAGRALRRVSYFSRETVASEVEIIAGTLVYGNVVGSPSAVLIRRESLLRAGPFSEEFPQVMDVEMWLRLAALGPVGYIPEPLCSYRLHPEAMTVTHRKVGRIRSDVVRITEMMLARVDTSPWARRVCWGRVAGSFLKQALFGLRHGYVRWPLEAIGQAVSIDPGFAGLGMFQLLFRPGLLGLHIREGRALEVRPGRTLSF
jgi:glycosyltransferase involved in cell wall biosynthesis